MIIEIAHPDSGIPYSRVVEIILKNRCISLVNFKLHIVDRVGEATFDTYWIEI